MGYGRSIGKRLDSLCGANQPALANLKGNQMRSKATAAEMVTAAIGMAVMTLTAIGMTALTVYVGASALAGPGGAVMGTGLLAATAMGMIAAVAWAGVGSGLVAACKAGR